MDRSTIAIVCLVLGCAANVWSSPVDKPVEGAVAPKPGAEKDGEPSKEDSTKFVFQRPPFLQSGWGGGPVAYGNASTQGEVQGLFATNENSLFVMSGPNSNAIANLTSTAAYFAQPINETNSEIDGGDSISQNLAGFTVTAQEDTQAYAEGEYIQFVNHGASYATGWGDSTANGTTYNPGPEGSGSGSGWKAPSKPKDQNGNAKQ